MATTTQSFDDPLGYDKAPSLSFKDAEVGKTYKGLITARPKLVQGRNFDDGTPKVWPDGNPVLSVVIMLTVQGEERSLWAQKPSAMFAALQAAQKEAGAGPLAEGGELWVKFTGETPNLKNPKLNPAKQYAVRYIPPAAKADPFADVPPVAQQTVNPVPSPQKGAMTTW